MAVKSVMSFGELVQRDQPIERLVPSRYILCTDHGRRAGYRGIPRLCPWRVRGESGVQRYRAGDERELQEALPKRTRGQIHTRPQRLKWSFELVFLSLP